MLFMRSKAPYAKRQTEANDRTSRIGGRENFFHCSKCNVFAANEPFSILKKELQLLGIRVMLLDSKYEDIWAPEINDFVCICGSGCTHAQVLAMESMVYFLCKALDGELYSWPIHPCFLAWPFWDKTLK